MPRLFTGLEIPQPVALQLQMLQGGIHGARWIDPADYHITLRFIGDIDDMTAGEIVRRLAAIDAAPFSVRLQGTGFFGGKRPHSVHALVEPNAALTRLREAHERACRAAGLQPETRRFVPHVTIARCRGADPAEVRAFTSRHGLFAADPFTVERFALFSARPSRGGGPYVVEQVFPFG